MLRAEALAESCQAMTRNPAWQAAFAYPPLSSWCKPLLTLTGLHSKLHRLTADRLVPPAAIAAVEHFVKVIQVMHVCWQR